MGAKNDMRAQLTAERRARRDAEKRVAEYEARETARAKEQAEQAERELAEANLPARIAERIRSAAAGDPAKLREETQAALAMRAEVRAQQPRPSPLAGRALLAGAALAGAERENRTPEQIVELIKTIRGQIATGPQPAAGSTAYQRAMALRAQGKPGLAAAVLAAERAPPASPAPEPAPGEVAKPAPGFLNSDGRRRW